MKNYYSLIYCLNLITLTNMIREIRNKAEHQAYCDLDKSFIKVLLRTDFNDLVRNVGLNPLIFFKRKPISRAIETPSTRHVITSWKIIDASSHDYIQTLLSATPNKKHQALPLCSNFQLAVQFPRLLIAGNNDLSQIFAHSLLHVGLHYSDAPPTLSQNSFTVPMQRLLQSDLSHNIVATLSGSTTSQINKLRQNFVLNHQFQRNTGVQYRELERNSFNRFALYLAVQYFKFFVELGVTPLTAFLDTIEALNHAPSLSISLSENFHLATNLFYWLKAQNLIEATNYADNGCKEVDLTDFPDNLHSFFNGKGERLPRIKRISSFAIPSFLDLEHQRFLKALNVAIENNDDLNIPLNQYCEGAFR